MKGGIMAAMFNPRSKQNYNFPLSHDVSAVITDTKKLGNSIKQAGL